jgi:hypothetical protein
MPQMKAALSALIWVQRHRWAMLLAAILLLIVISPYPGVYDRNDNLISPLTAVVVLAVTLSTARRLRTCILVAILTLVWVVVSIVTDGSGLFASVTTIAPLLFLAVMGSIFFLLASWLSRAKTINGETLCAAICGYLIVGLFWTGIYALVQSGDQHAIVSINAAKLEHGDLIYFSYTTLTTMGFGDLTPRNPTARMWTILEAVSGTFYNAIVIARLVTLYGFKPQLAE